MATTGFKDDPFWMSKMKYQFEIWFDLDGNGSIENEDFNKLFDNMVEAKGLSPDSPMYDRAKNMKQNMWTILQHNADGDEDKSLSLSEWCIFFDDFAVQYNKRNYIPHWYKEFMAVTFFIMDKNGDELIDASDFVSYYCETHKLPLEIVNTAYKKITSNGKLNLDKFKDMMIGFTVSKDKEHTGNILGEMMVNGRLERMAKNMKDDPFWMSKMRHQFYTWFDCSRDGVIQKKDFDYILQGVVRSKGWANGSPLWKRVEDMTNNFWAELKRAGDTDKDDQITITEWCDFWSDFAANYNTDAELPFWYSEFLQVNFWLYDTNGDGWIDRDEFIAAYNGMYGIPLNIVAATFSNITKDEELDFDINLFREMMLGFTVSTDMKNPGNILGEMLVRLVGCETEFERTEFWEEKHRHEFYVWFDQDKNGVVEYKDFHQHAKNIIALTQWSKGSPMWVRCFDIMNGLWRELKRRADKDNDKKVTVDEWLDSMENMCREIKAKTMKIPYWYGSYLDLYFDVFDSLGNGDGWITKDEFVSAYRPFKIPDDVIEKCFDDMTYGGRIAMDRDFWNTCCIQFSTSTDINSPGNILGKMLIGKYN
ncbi:unnamed protein product [Owenia fusiformis]|uniref:EF-hand domain-containing protein n=1 Tax=Owenia fusiformis TaxID=6347 RepID=A0A8S4PJW5_OWEFU|nr:unnamed protein product [Owenia fusiformis]